MNLSNLFDDMSSRINNDPTYNLFAVGMRPKTEGDGYDFMWEKPICEIKVDDVNREFCLIINEEATAIATDQLVTLKGNIGKAALQYDAVACIKDTVDEYEVWIDMPVVTFGKSNEEHRYAVVVLSSCDEEA